MNLTNIIKLAIKYLSHYKRRYLFLFLALSFGFGIITLTTAVKEGMSNNLYYAMRGHSSGGDITIIGGEKGGGLGGYHLSKDYVDTIIDIINHSGLKIDHITKRDRGNDCTIFYNGDYINLKYFIGVDWENEKNYFESLDYVSGSYNNLNDNSVILSAAVADLLHIKVGDSLILQIQNNGQINTAPLILGATIKNNSALGYARIFVPLKQANELMGFKEGDCSLIGVALKNKNDADAANRLLQKMISQKLPTAGLILKKNDWRIAQDKASEGITVYVMTVGAEISEVMQIIDAVNILILFLYVMMLIIVLVSASVTYSLIVHERTREIGTMRSIGFPGIDIRLLLGAETFFLGTISIIAGFIFSLILAKLASFIPFDWFPSFEIFLSKGRLTASFDLMGTLRNIVSIYIILFLAVFSPSKKVSSAPLPDCLSA